MVHYRTKDATGTRTNLRRTSSTSYENILYDETGSATIVHHDFENNETHHQSKHSTDYSIILPPARFDNSLGNLHNGIEYNQRPKSLQDAAVTGNVDQQNSSHCNCSQNSTAQLGDGSCTCIDQSTVKSNVNNSALKENRDENSSKQTAKYLNNAKISNVSIKKYVSPQDQWVNSLNVFKHTDHSSVPKHVNTRANSSLRSPVFTQYAERTPPYKLQSNRVTNKHTSTYTPQTRMSHATTGGQTARPTAKLGQPAVNGTHSCSSFYAQYCDRRAMRNSSTANSSNIAALKVSNSHHLHIS